MIPKSKNFSPGASLFPRYAQKLLRVNFVLLIRTLVGVLWLTEQMIMKHDNSSQDKKERHAARAFFQRCVLLYMLHSSLSKKDLVEFDFQRLPIH